MTQPTLQLGDLIDWDGERKVITRIEDHYAVWFRRKGPFRDKVIARCHIRDYPSGVRLICRADQEPPC